MTLGYLLGYLPMLIDILFRLKFVKFSTTDLLRSYQFGNLLQRSQMWSQIEVVEERIFIIPDIYESCIEPGHHFFYGA